MPGIEDFFNFNNMAGGVSILTTVLSYGFTFLIIGGIAGLLMWKFRFGMKFPVKVDIFQLKSGVLQLVDTDSARRGKDKKTSNEFYELKKRRVKFKPPTFESLLQLKGGFSKLYIKELSQDEFELIDPRSFVSANADDYKRHQDEGMERHFKILSDKEAEIKWKTNAGAMETLLKWMPFLVVGLGLGLFMYFFGQNVLIPILSYSGAATQPLLDALKMSNQLLDSALRFCGQSVECMRNLGINSTVVGNSSVIP